MELRRLDSGFPYELRPTGQASRRMTEELAEMAELLNLRFIDYSDYKKITQI